MLKMRMTMMDKWLLLHRLRLLMQLKRVTSQLRMNDLVAVRILGTDAIEVVDSKRRLLRCCWEEEVCQLVRCQRSVSGDGGRMGRTWRQVSEIRVHRRGR